MFFPAQSNYLKVLITTVALLFNADTIARERPPTGVIAAPVKIMALSDKVEALGTVIANEAVTVSPKITEKIVSIHFVDGQRVQRGDLLVQLDDREEQANLRSEQAVLDERRSAYKRARELFDRKVGSEADLDAAQARVRQTESDIEAIRTRISAHQIHAPFAGIVGLRQVSEGALVESDDVLTTLDDLNQVKVDFSVPVVYLSQLSPGLVVEGNTSAYPKQTFSGKLQSLSSRVDPVTRTVTARAKFDNQDNRLLPGMLLQLNLQTRPRQALVVPESAVFAVGRTHYLYRIGEDQKVSRQEVLVGTRHQGMTEILDGAEVDALVVSHGVLKVRDGAAVNVIAVDQGDLDVAQLLRQSTEAEATP